MRTRNDRVALGFDEARDQVGADPLPDGDFNGTEAADIGALEFSDLTFADGFESGDTSAWSNPVTD